MTLLADYFAYYTTENLKSSIAADEFEKIIMDRIGVVDAEIEGYSKEDTERQRDLSIKFHWGHSHDFGSFTVDGKMGNRHIDLLEKFMMLFPISINSFKNKSILDIGCWTGGTALLLCALSSKVTAVEEVKKYAETAKYLLESFDLDGTVLSQSLYELNDKEHHDKYDRVNFPGVIYHLSDPVLALRILFNCLKIGGDILVETAGVKSDEPICRFEGNYIYHKNGTRKELNRGGWNYFKFSISALDRMMQEAGFENIEAYWDTSSQRIFAYGRKNSQKPICKAGLSVPSIR